MAMSDASDATPSETSEQSASPSGSASRAARNAGFDGPPDGLPDGIRGQAAPDSPAEEANLPEGLVRIGELSRRVGLSDHTLRAWETRYGLLRPHRSAGGFRLYSLDDERRIRHMIQLLATGLSPAEAAKVVLRAKDDETVVLRMSAAQAQARADGGLGPATGTFSASAPAGMPSGGPTDAPDAAPSSAAPASSSNVDHASRTETATPAGATGPTAGAGAPRAAGAPTAAGSGSPAARPSSLYGYRALLARSLDHFDEQGGHDVLDRLIAEYSLTTVLRDVVMPYLKEQGDRWQRGEISLIQEHFASQILRGRLAGLARGWATGSGPVAVIACPPHELHDLAAMVFGIVLHRGGWRVIYLGADTPVGQIYTEIEPRPALVMIAATHPTRFGAIRPDVQALAEAGPVIVAGAGATAAFAQATGAIYAAGDPVTEALRILEHGVPDAATESTHSAASAP